MANVTINNNYSVDMRDFDFSEIFYAYTYSYGSTIFRANYGSGNADEFRGSGFKYNSDGVPVAGTVTSYASIYNGTKVLTVDGASAAATAIVKAAKTYSTKDDVAVVTAILKGNDKITGGNGSDYLTGFAGNDTLIGNAGNDVLKGGTGNDKLYGGAGADKLYGEQGADIFIFKSIKDSTVAKSGRDTIFDFAKGDKIDLSAIDANSKSSGHQDFKYVGSAAFSGKAGELRVEKQASDTYIYADVNGDKRADFAIHLDDAYSFSKGDFLL